MRVDKRKRRNPKTGKIGESKTYYCFFRPAGSKKEIQINTECRQKQNAERKALELIKDYEADYAGDATRKLKKVSESPIADHLEVYLKHKHTELDGNQHWESLRNRLRKMMKENSWVTVGEITYESILEWRSDSNLASKTLKDYTSALRGFLDWMVDTGKMEENPTHRIKPLKRRRDSHRRAITKEERSKLLSVAGKRRIVYLMAMYTGLRRAELGKLRWDDVEFSSKEGESFLKVRASTTKNGKFAAIPLPEQVVQELLKFRKGLKRRKESMRPVGVLLDKVSIELVTSSNQGCHRFY